MSKSKLYGQDRVFETFLIILFGLVILTIIIPFAYLIMVSLTNQTNIRAFFLPDTHITLTAYRAVMNPKIFTAFGISVVRTVVGTSANMVVSIMFAYVLSKRDLPGRRGLNFYMVFTMFFSGGLIPGYLLTITLGLKNSYLVYIIPGLMSAYNCILLRNAFFTVPTAIAESILIDGGNDWHVLIHGVVPLSKPAIATIALFYAVGHWNAWFDAVLYMSDSSKFTLQVVLRSIVYNNQIANEMGANLTDLQSTYIPVESIINATLIVTTLPIVLVYPFVQRYFVKGVILGAVKQ